MKIIVNVIRIWLPCSLSSRSSKTKRWQIWPTKSSNFRLDPSTFRLQWIHPMIPFLSYHAHYSALRKTISTFFLKKNQCLNSRVRVFKINLTLILFVQIFTQVKDATHDIQIEKLFSKVTDLESLIKHAIEFLPEGNFFLFLIQFSPKTTKFLPKIVFPTKKQ